MTKFGKSSETQRRYTFGDFTLDVAAASLHGISGPIRLSPKAFELLMYLVERPGILVTKDELLDAIWAGTHVSEGSVNRAVATLRAALDDDADSPHIIETVPWRGYRFIAAVTPQSKARRAMVIHRGTQYALHDGPNVLGRAPECDVTIASLSISRRHAQIEITPETATITDLGSKNGTFVGNVRVDRATELNHGDEIRLGGEALRFLFTGGERRTITVETSPTERE